MTLKRILKKADWTLNKYTKDVWNTVDYVGLITYTYMYVYLSIVYLRIIQNLPQRRSKLSIINSQSRK